MVSLVVPGIFAVWAFIVYSGRSPNLRVVGGLLLAAAGLLAAYDGAARAQREYAATHGGRVTPGVVISRTDPTADETTWTPRRRRLSRDLRQLTVEGSRPHDVLGRWILTGSPYAWSVEYKYECERPRGCYGRDIVSEAAWHALYPGRSVDVRRPTGEIDSSRLDDNPQWSRAMADLTIATALLVASAAVSGKLTRRKARYATAPAVVTAIESVRQGDEPSWRIRFAYVDSTGAMHEAANEFAVDGWCEGDEGLAVFPPHQPELAMLRRPDAA